MPSLPDPSKLLPLRQRLLPVGSSLERRTITPESWEQLQKELLTLGGPPIDEWETAARLESLGYSDVLIQEHFARESIFALARDLFPSLISGDNPPQPSRLPPTWYSRFKADGIRFSRSLAYALPWLLLFFSERGVGLELSPERKLTPEAAAAVSISIMLSLIVNGGFLQIMARRGLFYQGMKEPALERVFLVRVFRLGLLVSGIVACAGLLGGFYSNWLPDQTLVLCAISFGLLSVLWLSCGILTVCTPTPAIAGVFSISVGVYLGLVLLTTVPVLTAQTASMVVAGLSTAWMARRALPALNVQEPLAAFPDPVVLGYLLVPYFWVGCGYFAFLFTDRWLAGTVVSFGFGTPFVAHPEYQLGIDLALLLFFLLVGWVEVCAFRFTQGVFDQAGQVDLLQGNFHKQVYNQYLRFLFGLGSLVAVILLLVWSLPDSIWVLLTASAAQAPIVRGIALLGTFGYGCLALALFQGLILFSFSQPSAVLWPLSWGFAINLVISYFLSNLFGFEFAVCGLVCGAATWLWLGAGSVRRLINELEYHYFAM
ncbi:MAG: hypothetical protein HY774_26565 [Acidobacteria bacterium]|nr:hypothetical protein [Acidobacteriota bacterium]